MGRYIGPKEKIERRLGSKLFLKGERSLSSKSATVKRMYPPGQHGKRFGRRLSEFGAQLKSKQKVRNIYRMLERQFKNWSKSAIDSKEESGTSLIARLENRLDNAVYRSGLAQSRDQARQVVNHGHILVNDKKISIPSYEIKKGDTISVKEGSRQTSFFKQFVPQWLEKHESPKWIKLDTAQMSSKIIGVPTIEESGVDPSDIQSLIEYYSR